MYIHVCVCVCVSVCVRVYKKKASYFEVCLICPSNFLFVRDIFYKVQESFKKRL